MKIKEFIRENAETTATSIKFFCEYPLKSLGQIIPVGMIAVSVVGFFVAIVKFVIAGGFSNQIAALKGDFFEGVLEGFTFGTVGVLTSGIVSIIILLLLLAELLVLIISYYLTESKVKKIIVSICLGLGIILFGVAGFILAVGFGVIYLSEQMEMKFVEILTAFDGMQTTTLVNRLMITAVVGAIALIVFIVFMLVSEHKWMIKNCVIALLLSYIFFPLTLLLVENFVPLIVGIVVVVVVGGTVFLGGKIFLSGEGELSDTSNTDESAGTSYFSSLTESKTKEKYQKKKEYDLNTIFWRDKGGYGIAVPQADCIYMKNAWGEKTYVCTVCDFEKGNVAIINKRVRITNIAGCKTPER